MLLQFFWSIKVPKGVWVYALLFWRKMWTYCRQWCFTLVALYYGKMLSMFFAPKHFPR